MNIISSEYGFTELYLKKNVIEKLQTESLTYPKPEGTNIEINADFDYTSNIYILISFLILTKRNLNTK